MNHMADTIQNLLEQQKEQEKKKRELELQMLQYQLNPHFLFNTLNSLRFVAAMHNDQIVSDGIQALSSLLQNNAQRIRMNISPCRKKLENLEIILPFSASGMQEVSNILSMWRMKSCSPVSFPS